MKIVEVIVDAGHSDTIVSIAQQYEVTDYWLAAVDEDGRQAIRMLVKADIVQTVLDRLQTVIGGHEASRIIVQPVEVALPTPPEPPKEEVKEQPKQVYHEEIYNSIKKNTRLDSHYVTLVVLSTVVAAIGLVEDNIAVIIGAMVIAPLLGPNLALALGTALGDRELMGQAFISIIAGLLLAALLSLGIGLLWTPSLASAELIARTDVGMDSVMLALASGAAAVLSLTTGVSTVLVGVMVAVALLPPTSTLGLMISLAEWDLARGAGLLLAVNIVCVNLAAKLVFLFKGVRPRTWLEKKKAKQSMLMYLVIWLATLLLLIFLITSTA